MKNELFDVNHESTPAAKSGQTNLKCFIIEKTKLLNWKTSNKQNELKQKCKILLYGELFYAME
jgi:hypothetical protein